jgi:hypothetical protein
LSKKACGERSADVNEKDRVNWKRDVLPGLLENYRKQNADESGLFFQCLPDNTLTFRQEKCHSGMHSKERVTLLLPLLSTNMGGSEKIKLLLIRKTKNLRFFRGIKWLLVGTVIAGSLIQQSSWIQRIFLSAAMRIRK